MSLLYVSEYNDEKSHKWGLFYEDENDIRRHLSVDFKHVAFDSEEDAWKKLEEIEAEKKSEEKAVPFSFDEAKAFAESQKWKFASTYAKTAPHEYIVKRWLSEEDQLLFERLVQEINKDAVIGYFYEHENRYLILGDHYYWYMPCYPDNMAVDLINRTTTDYLEYRDGAYHYKGNKS